MIFVTHDLGIVRQVCDKVAVMYGGKIVEWATTEELFHHPRHPYTRSLLRCLPTVDAAADRLASIDGQPPGLHGRGAGCAFAPRCPEVLDRCASDPPPMVEAGPVRRDVTPAARCWLDV
jgi:oligopeptide/dipeptide ABC transporter ATP-binding protein